MDPSEIIEILGLKIIKNSIGVKDKLKFQILFELKENLKENLGVEFIYIHSPTNEKRDEKLDVYEIPTNRVGKFKVTFLVTPPKIFLKGVPSIFGITLLLIQFKYKYFEFTRVGYYVNNDLNGPIEKDSNSNIFFKTQFTERNILINEPRVTKFFCSFI
jgi:hypothetical protein